MSPPTSRPDPVPSRPVDHDRRPSLRLRVALTRLRHGEDPADVAAATKVPLALVEVLADELTHRRRD